MSSSPPTRILVVANRTAALPWLLQEIEARVRAGRCELVLLVPPVGDRHPDWTPALAREQLERAAGRPIGSLDAGADPVAAIAGALRDRRFDEVIVSVRTSRGPRLLRRDLARRIEALGVPVTAVVPGARPAADQTVLKVRW